MNVKDFILQHPHMDLDIMTPKGAVTLNTEDAKALLGGKGVKAIPGVRRKAVEVSAEELLSQEVKSVVAINKSWSRLVTDYPQEETLGTGLDPSEILARLNEKLDQNYSDFVNEWLKLEPSVLIENAEEISATKQAYDELKSNEYNMAYFEYLLRFKNPLEVVRDKWKEEQLGPDISGEMDHALWYLMDKQDAEQDYELDEEYKPPGMGQGVTMC